MRLKGQYRIKHKALDLLAARRAAAVSSESAVLSQLVTIAVHMHLTAT